MAYKSFKSKIGMFFAGAYLLLVCVAIIGVVIGPPDAMSGLALMFAAIPWSFMLFEGLDGIAPPLPIVGFALYAFCILLNAIILYFLGLLLSLLIKRANRVSETSRD